MPLVCPNREELVEYIAGKLPDAASDSLAEHLDSCPQCQAELVALPDPDDTLVSQLRKPVVAEPYLDEPECGKAVAKVKALLGTPEALAASPDASATFLPQQLGEYQLIERLGRGGMGTVYKARQSRLDRVVALKILSRGRTDDPHAVVRFEREMKAIGRLDHPNIVQAYDAREIDGTLVLIMEFIDGLDLAEIVRRVGPLPVAEACEMVRQTALALQCAHEHRLVHRDIKPSNIMLSRSGEVKLLDLGLARFFAEGVTTDGANSAGAESVGVAVELPPQPIAAAPAGAESAGAESAGAESVGAASVGVASVGAAVELPPQREVPADEEMTNTGQAMGTADYMAPEQASDSRTVDIRADIYSLGCTLYKLLSGQAPFGGPEYRGTLDKMNAHVQQTPPPLRQFVPDLPEELAKIVDRMLAKNPVDRFAAPAEVASALEPFCPDANLPELIARAISLPPESWAKAEKSRDANFITPQSSTAPNRRRPNREKPACRHGVFRSHRLIVRGGHLDYDREKRSKNEIRYPAGQHSKSQRKWRT